MKTTYVFIGLLAFALGIGIAQYYLPHSEPALDTSGNGNTRVPVTPGKFGGKKERTPKIFGVRVKTQESKEFLL